MLLGIKHGVLNLKDKISKLLGVRNETSEMFDFAAALKKAIDSSNVQAINALLLNSRLVGDLNCYRVLKEVIKTGKREIIHCFLREPNQPSFLSFSFPERNLFRQNFLHEQQFFQRFLLNHALELSNGDVFFYLYDLDPVVTNYVNANIDQYFYQVGSDGNIAMLASLLEKFSDTYPNAPGHALAGAARYDKKECVKYLLTIDSIKQAMLHDYLGPESALKEAIFNGRFEIANALLQVEGAHDALLLQDEVRLKWALITVLKWILNGLGVTNESISDYNIVFTPDQSDIIRYLTEVMYERQIDICSHEPLAIAPELLTNLLEIHKQHLTRKLFMRLLETQFARDPLERLAPEPSNDNVDNWMSSLLPKEIVGLSFEQLRCFIKDQNLLTNSTYDNDTWHAIATQLGIQDSWHSELDDDQKLKVSSFLTKMDFIISNYPSELIKTLGLARMAQMPYLDLGTNTGGTDYLDFVTSEQMGGEPVALGNDSAARPFLTVVYESKMRRDVLSHPELQQDENRFARNNLGVQVETLFKRYTEGNDVTWATGSSFRGGNGELLRSVMHNDNYLSPTLLNCLKKLIVKGETVGFRSHDRRSGIGKEFDMETARLLPRKPK